MTTPYSDINAPYGNPESKEPYSSTGVPYVIFDEGVNVLDAVFDPAMTIQGFNVSVSGLEYTYQETGRTNDTDAILYFGISYIPIADPREWVLSPRSVAYPSGLPSTITASFSNPDPEPNPVPTATNVVGHPELSAPVFRACLWNPITNRISTIYRNFNDLSVGDDFLEGTLSQKSFNTSTNEITLQFKVDTTHNSSWFNVDTSTALFDYLTTKIDTTPSVTGDYSYSYVTNASAGGHTAPFDARYSVALTDGVPSYNAGNFVIWEWVVRVLEYGNLSDYVGNAVFSLTTSTGSTYASSLAGVITDSIVPWIGIDSFTITETQATIVKSYAEWTNDYTFTHTHGGTTNSYTITGGATTIDFSTLSPPITPNNNDVFEIIQPINGATLSITFQKDFTVAYTGTPPTDWTVTVTSVGINFPYTIDIEDASNNKLDHLEMTQATEVFDIRDLPLETDPHGHTHIDWYGFGTVFFKHSGITKSFDASYIQDGDGTNLSGAEIQGYNTTVSNDPYTFTYVETGRLFDSGHTLYYNDYLTGSGTQESLVSDGLTATTITKTFVDSDFEVSPPYTNETNIPVLNRDVKAVLYDGSAYSELYSVSKSFDVGDTYLKAFISSAVFSAGYLALTLFVNTAQNSVWRKLSDSIVQADYDTNKLTLSDFTGNNGYTLDFISSSVPPYDKAVSITHSTGNAGGDFSVGTLLFEIINDITETDITELRFASMRDPTTTWKTNFDITQDQTFSITAQKIDSFTYTQTTIDITKSVSDAFDWSYRIAGGSIVNVTGASGLTQSVSVSLSNGQLIEVFQPYFAGATLTDTTSGLGTNRLLLATFDGATYPSGNDVDPTGGTSGLTYTRSTQYEVPTRAIGDYSAVAGTMTISNLSDLDTMPGGGTISLWFKYTGIFDKALFTTSSYGTAGQGVKVQIIDLGINGIGFQVSSSASDYVSWGATTPITAANEWHHIFVSINNTSATLVLNGEYRGLPTSTSGTFSLSNWVSSQSITLGDTSLGFIDHFTFYDGVPTGLTTIPISGETATFYGQDTLLETPDLRATFEGENHGDDANDINPSTPSGTVIATYSYITPTGGVTAKQGTKVADLGLSEAAPDPVKKVQIPNYSTIDTQGYTVSFWLYYKSTGTSFTSLIATTNYSDSNGGFNMYYYDKATPSFSMYINTGQLMWEGSFTLTDATWYFITMYVDNTRAGVKLYIDGNEVNRTSGLNITLAYYSGQYLNIGSHSSNSTGLDADQYADDLRIYDRELSASEVKLLYNSY